MIVFDSNATYRYEEKDGSGRLLLFIGLACQASVM